MASTSTDVTAIAENMSSPTSSIPMMTRKTQIGMMMALTGSIHNGEVMIHQDHAIAPVSLSISSTTNNVVSGRHPILIFMFFYLFLYYKPLQWH